jgi:hypothetical protein
MEANAALTGHGTGLFSFHHQHGARMDAGAGPRGWHQDYEQYPQTDRDLLMVHCFYYPNGLDGQIGDLILLPGSQVRTTPSWPRSWPNFSLL